MTPETPVTPEIQLPEFPENNSSNYGISIDTGILESPETGLVNSPFNPPVEVVPGQTRILLSESASRHLDAAGAKAFAIVHRDMSDGNTGRWAITLCPVEWQTARDASAVLMGRAKAFFPKPSKPITSAALTPHEIRKA